MIGYSGIDTPLPCIMLEILPNGSLSGRLHKEQKHHLTFYTRVKILRQIASALAFLQHPKSFGLRVIHLDVTSDNIVLDSHNDSKLCDFGLSMILSQEKGLSEAVTNFRKSKI